MSSEEKEQVTEVPVTEEKPEEKEEVSTVEEKKDEIPSTPDTNDGADESAVEEKPEELDKEALIAEAKSLGLTGNMANWKPETIAKKIAEVKAEEKAEEIDPRVQAILDLNTRSKRKEFEKQKDIYTAMANIKVVRS